MHLSQKSFGMVHDREINLYAIGNDNGVVVTLNNFGGIISLTRQTVVHFRQLFLNRGICANR